MEQIKKYYEDNPNATKQEVQRKFNITYTKLNEIIDLYNIKTKKTKCKLNKEQIEYIQTSEDTFKEKAKKLNVSIRTIYNYYSKKEQPNLTKEFEKFLNIIKENRTLKLINCCDMKYIEKFELEGFISIIPTETDAVIKIKLGRNYEI